MSNVAEIQKMLDKRGIRYVEADYMQTMLWIYDGMHFEYDSGSLGGAAPTLRIIGAGAREVESVMGRGECRIVGTTTDGLASDDAHKFFKLSCGHFVGFPYLGTAPSFCPVCGRKVVG